MTLTTSQRQLAEAPPRTAQLSGAAGAVEGAQIQAKDVLLRVDSHTGAADSLVDELVQRFRLVQQELKAGRTAEIKLEFMRIVDPSATAARATDWSPPSDDEG